MRKHFSAAVAAMKHTRKQVKRLGFANFVSELKLLFSSFFSSEFLVEPTARKALIRKKDLNAPSFQKFRNLIALESHRA